MHRLSAFVRTPAFLAGTVGAVAGATLLSGAGQAVKPGASFFEVVAQRRLCDTRTRPGAPVGYGYQRLGAKWIRVGITDQPGVPADAVAAVLSVTAVSRGARWNPVTVFPAGEPMPDTSSLDLGAFESAVRALDTRSSAPPAVGSISRVNLNGLVPSDATAVVGTLIVVTAAVPGFVTAFPRGTAVPDTSNLNVGAGETRAVGVITRLATEDGALGVALYNFCGAHLLFDVVGYMTGSNPRAVSADGLFVPITPTRVHDTRRAKMRV